MITHIHILHLSSLRIKQQLPRNHHTLDFAGTFTNGHQMRITADALGNFGVRIGQHELDGLMFGNRLSKGETFPGVRKRLFIGGLG